MLLKHVYENLKNSLTLVLFFTAGSALALPQDWSCEEFQLTRASQNNDENTFIGEHNNYRLTITDFDTAPNFILANCGSAGCLGTITNLKTGKEETLRFDCSYSLETKRLSCYLSDGNEYLLTQTSGTIYQTKTCTTPNSHTIVLDTATCNQCHCILSYYDKNNIKQAGTWSMNCTRESPTQIRCFTNNGYTAWRNYDYINSSQDFQNCVNLKL